MWSDCYKQYWESASFRRALGCWRAQGLLSYSLFHYAIKWHFFLPDANQGLLPLEGGRRLSEGSGSAAILAPLTTEPRAVVLLLHQKRKRRLQSQNPLWNQRRLLFKSQFQTSEYDSFACRTVYYLLKSINYLDTCLDFDLGQCLLLLDPLQWQKNPFNILSKIIKMKYLFLTVISQKLLNLNLLYQRLRKLHQNVIQRRRERRKKRRLVKDPQLGPSQGQDLDHILHLILDQEGVIDHGQGRTSVYLDCEGRELSIFFWRCCLM